MKLPRFPIRKSGLLVVWLVCVVAIVVFGLTCWRGDRIVSQGELQALEVLARDSGSTQVWGVFEVERARGLSEAGAARVREAAKAAPLPYGLLSDR